MGDVFLYKNQLWKPIYNFEYSGDDKEFTLNPGKYLMICHGAHGGEGYRFPGVVNYGGVAYGVLDLKKTSTFYAVVGGNGEKYKSDGAIPQGGYNGGGNGGGGHPQYPRSGAAGGGASDIRLSNDHSPLVKTTVLKIPDEYDRLDYVQSTGSQYINTKYTHKANTRIICDCEVSSNNTSSYAALFGARYRPTSNSYTNMLVFFVRYNGTNVPGLGISGWEGYGSIDPFIYDQRINVVYFDSTFQWYQDDELKGYVSFNYQQVDGATPLMIFDFNTPTVEGGVQNYGAYSKAKIYEFKIYEDDELKAYLVPCKSKNDDTVGLYDIVNDMFLPPSSDLVEGNTLPDSEKSFYFTEELAPDKSLYSRIIVAGGGGGALNSGANGSYGINNYSGYGGGVYGGYVSSYSTDTNSGKYASQTDGYSFGIGMTPKDKTSYPDNGAEGASGGGGGWYGGYSSGNTNLLYSSSNGGGGSGYVLTDKSDKPEYYMDGYNMEDYYFTDIFMNSIGAIEPRIMVCVPIKVCSPGDTIIAPCVGDTESLTLKAGIYKLKCWGGDGDPRYVISSTARGGYAQGTLTLEEPTDIYVNVGGAGVCPGNYSSFSSIHRPTISFNGGGRAGNPTDIRSTFGGGASDIRIGSNDLLARVIVAGGAGGHGSAETSGSRFGGAGGGESGNASSETDYGHVAGPGTQSSSPTYSQDTRADGKFGVGGNGFAEGGGFGGAGGGGWYGGSGCIPDYSNDDDRGGCGGSGYVLTDKSYRPEGYLLDDGYCLTDTSLVTGGNDLPIGMSKIEIEVIDSWSTYILCKDDEGYKKFDNDTNEWVYFKSETPTIDDFVGYGSQIFKSDNGLMDKFELYVYDENDLFDTMDVYVVPPTLKMRMATNTSIKVNQVAIDADFDENDISFDIQTSRKGVGDDSRIMLDITVDKKNEDDKSGDIKVYCVNLYANSMNVSNRYIPPKDEKTEEPSVEEQEKKYLLKVGTGNNIPVEYRNYLGILNGNSISTIYTSASCEHNRMLYIAIVIKNSTDNINVLRIIQFNLLDGKSRIIRDIQPSEINNATYFGGLLADDNYLYFTRSGNDTYHVLYRVSIKNPTEPVSTFDVGGNADNNFESFGKIAWWNNHTIIIDYRRGFMLFDTNVLKFEARYYANKSNTRRDMSVGRKLVIDHSASTSYGFWIYDVDEDVWYDGAVVSPLSTNGVACSCYGDGKFYIVQASYLTIWDEETMSIIKTIPIPWTEPKSASYTNGIVYVTCSNSDRLWIYDTKENVFNSMYISWSVGSYSEANMFRPTAFNGYLFLPYWQLGIVNYVDYSKYNMGYKVNQYNALFNTEHEKDCEYDSTFVTFYDSYMKIHDGIVSLPLTKVSDKEETIKRSSINKSDYRMIKKISFTENSDPKTVE